ncbi:hypothetical protein [Tenacibaculum soleae]|uniref:hypothetical protein n=1 Tax=Tenacibaculum soleae TaxID=447689 RepID=UPI003AB4F8E3
MKEFIAVVILETKNMSTGTKHIEETFIQVVKKNRRKQEKNQLNMENHMKTYIRTLIMKSYKLNLSK